MVLRISVIVLLFLLFPLTVFSVSPEHDYQRAKSSYHQLLNSPKKQLYRDNWIKVIDQFIALSEKYPEHPKASSSLYMAGKTCRKLYGISRARKDILKALDLFSSIVESYPNSSLADDALVFSGEIYESNLKGPAEAYIYYKKAVDRYPSGDMVSTARKKVTELAAYAPVQKEATLEKGEDSFGEAAKPPMLTGVRYWSNPGYTRVVIDLSAQAEYKANFLKGDVPKIYVDICGASPAFKVGETTIVEDGLLSRIRTGMHDDSKIRVVLDLLSFKSYKVFPLKDPYRIVVDISGERIPELKTKETEFRAPPPGQKDSIAGILEKVQEDRPLKVHIPSATTHRGLRRIVVDPGHGGKDPGAIGPSGVLEKDVTLAMAKVLSAQLESELGCEVILTRDKDVYLPLEERTAIANKVGADLFISIHANANNDRRVHGIETFYLNFSKNDMAADVAARENGTSIEAVGDLEMILFDLMANAKINESSRLASEIQKSLIRDLRKYYKDIKDMGVRQGPFYVLLGASMPSVLVESAFISNKKEETRLTKNSYHKKTAAAIAKGVHNYAAALNLIAIR